MFDKLNLNKLNQPEIMQVSFKCKQTLLRFCFSLMIAAANMQENDFKCLKYKKLIFEETKTFSYFLPGAHETSFTQDVCSASKSFVVGGENALPKEFAFAARLGHMADNEYVNWFCGGTLLSKTFVLTAAHCFYAALGEVNIVRLGELDFNSDTDDAKPKDYMVQQLIEHPDYNHAQSYNDIGLIMLSSRVEFDRYKHPACLPTRKSLKNSNFVTAVGWGHTKFSGESSSHLQKVTLMRYSYAKCQWLARGPEGQEKLPDGLKFSQLCAGSTEAKDTCQGDSGGALLAQHPEYPCMSVVVGITSLGISGCAIPNIPAIYTNVSYYIDWINMYIN